MSLAPASILRCGLWLFSAGLALATSPASAKPLTLCVWDAIGASGPMYQAAKGYALSMQQQGTELDVKPYTDERVAAEDFRVGQCDALLATSMRTRPYNAVAAAVDYVGAATIVRNGAVDLGASYEVGRKAIHLFAAPGAAKLAVQGNFELGGIVPAGALYMMVRDRTLFTRGFAGTRMPAFDHDRAQAYLIQKVGAQPVSSDLINFANKFNNGLVDVVFAPAVVYQPLELHRGMGSHGAIASLPMGFTSMQMVFDRQRFPTGFGERSRTYWAQAHDEALALVRKSELAIPRAMWLDLPADTAAQFVVGQAQSRVELAQMGVYNKQGLKIMKRIRCAVNAAAAECSNTAELVW